VKIGEPYSSVSLKSHIHFWHHRSPLLPHEYHINYLCAASFADPLKKREEFSVSLRKKKKQEIIQSKRKRAEWNGGSAQFNTSPTLDQSVAVSDPSDDDVLKVLESLMP
jgi:hypothetical protein